MIVIARFAEVSLNGKEYVLDGDNRLLRFANEKEAEAYLCQHVKPSLVKRLLKSGDIWLEEEDAE